jgi:hypothetical protein
VGVCFQVWHDLDIGWASAQETADSNLVAAARAPEYRDEARSMYVLFRNYRNKLGVSEEQILSLTEFNETGKAGACGRLKYWVAQPDKQ